MITLIVTVSTYIGLEYTEFDLDRIKRKVSNVIEN